MAHPKLGKHTRAHRQGVSGSASQSPRLKPSPRLQLQLQLCLRLPKVPRPPHKGSSVKASVCQCEDRRTGVTPGLLSAWGWCPPVLFVQIKLRQNLSQLPPHKTSTSIPQKSTKNPALRTSPIHSKEQDINKLKHVTYY